MLTGEARAADRLRETLDDHGGFVLQKEVATI